MKNDFVETSVEIVEISTPKREKKVEQILECAYF